MLRVVIEGHKLVIVENKDKVNQVILVKISISIHN